MVDVVLSRMSVEVFRREGKQHISFARFFFYFCKSNEVPTGTLDFNLLLFTS